MQAIQTLSRKSLDQLETDLITLSQHINASEYEFMVMLREFDLRQGWKPYLFNNCAEWLNMKCGISPTTAREKLRVANALFDLPQTSAAFQKGDLSYSKARCLTRVATSRDEEQLLEYALRATANQVDNHCQQLRNAQRAYSTADARRVYESRYLCKNEHADGSVTIGVELPKESAALVMKTLEFALSQLALAEDEGNAPHRALGDEEAIEKSAKLDLRKQQGDALVHMAKGFLRGSGVIAVTEDEQGNPLNVGRKHSMVQPALRRALVSRDKCCRFPGCTHEKWLDAHHVKHWADGGETSLENTIMLCSTHHRLLHEGGFRINNSPEGDWQFAGP